LNKQASKQTNRQTDKQTNRQRKKERQGKARRTNKQEHERWENEWKWGGGGRKGNRAEGTRKGKFTHRSWPDFHLHAAKNRASKGCVWVKQKDRSKLSGKRGRKNRGAIVEQW